MIKINYDQVKHIYNQYILPKLNTEYLNKYSTLPIHENTKTWSWEEKDFSRIISLLEFKEFIEKNNFIFEDVLISNGSNDPELNFIKYKNIFFMDYDVDKSKDLHTLTSEKNYDFFMTNQTLEHTYDPCMIIRNIYNIMKHGGIIYFNVPSLCPPHNTPHHYYNGFTPVGLACMVQQAGFKLLDVGFWGNKEYTMHLFETNSWPDYRQIKTYINDFNYSVISWVFAQK